MQQRGILRHHGDMGAQALLGDAGDVLAIDQDAPALQLEEAQQHVDQGRLAGARLADQPDPLARRDREIDVLQHAARRAIAETHVLEADGATRHLSVRRRRAGRASGAARRWSACRPAPRRHSRRSR